VIRPDFFKTLGDKDAIRMHVLWRTLFLSGCFRTDSEVVPDKPEGGVMTTFEACQ
jgi:hypothetical protein